MKFYVLIFSVLLSCNGGSYVEPELTTSDTCTTQLDSIFSVVDSAVQVVNQKKHEKEFVIDSLKKEVENHKSNKVVPNRVVRPIERRVVYDTVTIYVDSLK